MGINSKLRDAVERKVQTASQSNTSVIRHGTVTGTQILFDFKFKGAPTVILTAMCYAGMPVACVESLLQDTSDYYVGANIKTAEVENGYYITAPMITINWVAIGSGIEGESDPIIQEM